MIDLFVLLVAIGATTKRVNTGNTVGRVASVISQLYLPLALSDASRAREGCRAQGRNRERGVAARRRTMANFSGLVMLLCYAISLALSSHEGSGRGGIRTHGGLPHARFRVECLKPDSATLPDRSILSSLF